jgi:hypothetical protein
VCDCFLIFRVLQREIQDVIDARREELFGNLADDDAGNDHEGSIFCADMINVHAVSYLVLIRYCYFPSPLAASFEQMQQDFERISMYFLHFSLASPSPIFVY